VPQCQRFTFGTALVGELAKTSPAIVSRLRAALDVPAAK
jgi:hypothetical protein